MSLTAPSRPLHFDALDLPPEEIERRFRAAAARGTPAWFWPEVDVAEWRAALREIERVTSSLLLHPRTHCRLEIGGDAAALGIAGFTSGMGPLLGWWVERGMLDVRPDGAALLALHLAHARARHERLAEVMDDALDALGGAGLAPVVVKGMHTARALFAEPGVRPMCDVDLVVAQADVPAAERALAAAGFHREAATVCPRPYHAHWLPPGSAGVPRSLQLMHAEEPRVVNLHGSFDRELPGGGSGAPLGEPAENELAPWNGRGDARVLAGAFLPAYLALHASRHRHNLSLLRLSELVLLLRGGEDQPRLLSLLERTGTAGRAYPALALAEALCPGTLEPAVLARLEAAAPKRVRAAYRDLRPADVRRAEGPAVEDYFLWDDGAWSRVRRAARLLVPTTSPGELARVYARRIPRLLGALGGRNGTGGGHGRAHAVDGAGSSPEGSIPRDARIASSSPTAATSPTVPETP